MSYNFVDFLWGYSGDEFHLQAVTQAAYAFLNTGALGPHEHGQISFKELFPDEFGEHVFSQLEQNGLSTLDAGGWQLPSQEREITTVHDSN